MKEWKEERDIKEKKGVQTQTISSSSFPCLLFIHYFAPFLSWSVRCKGGGGSRCNSVGKRKGIIRLPERRYFEEDCVREERMDGRKEGWGFIVLLFSVCWIEWNESIVLYFFAYNDFTYLYSFLSPSVHSFGWEKWPKKVTQINKSHQEAGGWV